MEGQIDIAGQFLSYPIRSAITMSLIISDTWISPIRNTAVSAVIQVMVAELLNQIGWSLQMPLSLETKHFQVTLYPALNGISKVNHD